MTIYTRREKRSQGFLQELPSGYDSFSDSAGETYSAGLLQKGLTFFDINVAQPLGLVPDEGHYTAEQARERLKVHDVDFAIPEDGMSVRTFNLLAERDIDRKQAADRAARAPEENRSFLASLAGGLAGSLADPANLLLSITPVSYTGGRLLRGAEHFAAREAALASAGSWAARQGTRLRFGAQEAFAGSLVWEGFNQAFIGDNYGAAQGLSESDTNNALANIALGTLAGTVFDVAGGGLFDALGISSYQEANALARLAELQALQDKQINVARLSEAYRAFGSVGEQAEQAFREGKPVPDLTRRINLGEGNYYATNLRTEINRMLNTEGGEARFNGVKIARILDDRSGIELENGIKASFETLLAPSSGPRVLDLNLPGASANKIAKSLEDQIVRGDQLPPEAARDVREIVREMEEMGEDPPDLVTFLEEDSGARSIELDNVRERLIAGEETREAGEALLESMDLGQKLTKQIDDEAAELQMLEKQLEAFKRAAECGLAGGGA